MTGYPPSSDAAARPAAASSGASVNLPSGRPAASHRRFCASLSWQFDMAAADGRHGPPPARMPSVLMCSTSAVSASARFANAATSAASLGLPA